MTQVRNLATGERRSYTLPPEQAVVAAWYQAQGNWNTWEYDYENAPLIEGEHTVACDDWCALKDQASSSATSASITSGNAP